MRLTGEAVRVAPFMKVKLGMKTPVYQQIALDKSVQRNQRQNLAFYFFFHLKKKKERDLRKKMSELKNVFGYGETMGDFCSLQSDLCHNHSLLLAIFEFHKTETKESDLYAHIMQQHFAYVSWALFSTLC